MGGGPVLWVIHFNSFLSAFAVKFQFRFSDPHVAVIENLGNDISPSFSSN